MCGIFGAVVLEKGKKWDIGIIRALTWANRERGTDSLGFFDSSGKMTKGAGDPSDLLRADRITKWLKQSQETSWFVAGHTRFATRGKVNRRNSHPFRYGRIIGSHNGVVDAPTKFNVDSEHLFWALNKQRGKYQKALQDISGYWGLSWYDGEHFYLMVHNGELAYVVIEGVLYYSSGWAHLDSCTGGDSKPLSDNQVLRINSGGVVDNSEAVNSPVAPFVSKAASYTLCGEGWWSKDGDNTYKQYTSRNYASGGRGGAGKKENNKWQSEHNIGGYLEEITSPNTNTDTDARDYDADWQQAWMEYSTQSEHDIPDEEWAEREHERYSG